MEMKPQIKGQGVGLKIVIIGFLIVALLVPVLLIMALISDRESSRDMAVRETSAMWGNAQTFGVAVVTIPYIVNGTTKDGSVIERKRHLHIFPENIVMHTNVMPIVRKRGIYNVVLYNADVSIDGTFIRPDQAAFPDNTERIEWDNAVLNAGITDVRGIVQTVTMAWNDSAVHTAPGVSCPKVVPEGASAKVDFSLSPKPAYSFQMKMAVRGSGELRFIPSGRDTKVIVTSPWSAPSFIGAFLPDTRSVGSDGFTAEWNISEFNRKLPLMWTGNAPELQPASFGVSLLDQVDIYRKTMRSVKYAILFIALTFGAFFMMETLSNARLHAMHYILVGFAVTLFYLLLVALSEQIPFASSYVIASGATVGLITLYIKAVAGAWKPAGIIAVVLVTLYALLYVLLQLEDYALLVGSVVLFCLLALVMMLTRKLDWGGLKNQQQAELEAK